MARTSPPKPMPSKAVHALIMLAGMVKRSEIVHLVPGEMRFHSAASSDVAKAFIQGHPKLASQFLNLGGTSVDLFLRELQKPHDEEPQPAPRSLPENPTEEELKRFNLVKERKDQLRADGAKEVFTRPIKEALSSAKESAISKGEHSFGVGEYVSILFETESIARDALLVVADPTRIEAALLWLRSQPDPDDEIHISQLSWKYEREMLNRMWPKIRGQSQIQDSEKMIAIQDAHYEEDRDLYESPLNIAARLSSKRADPESDFMWRVGVCLHGAGNEARMRNAAECTLDHLLLALLQDGTDTAEFLDRRNVDRDQWMKELDAALPRFEEGPRWPPNDRALSMSLTTNSITVIKSLPVGVELKSLSREDRSQYFTTRIDLERLFTDLVLLRNVHEEPKTVAYRLFREAGISRDQLATEIKARETGDAEWWLKPPDLVTSLAQIESPSIQCSHRKYKICEEAARFEARMRGSAIVEFDDLLMALLVPGTDLSDLIVSNKLCLETLRTEIDALSPRSTMTIMFPSTENISSCSVLLPEGQFSDLMLLESSYAIVDDFKEQTVSPGLQLLAHYGIDRSAIRARLLELGIGKRT